MKHAEHFRSRRFKTESKRKAYRASGENSSSANRPNLAACRFTKSCTYFSQVKSGATESTLLFPNFMEEFSGKGK